MKILENTSGNKFKVLKKEEVNITKESDDSLYLKSTQPVYWRNKGEAISLAETLIKGEDKNIDKVQAIYDYIVNNIEYDYEKMDLLNSDYVPDIDNV
ncbi:transglutaminase-like domain-containing protein [Tissierella sp. MSJ-40]|uniref:Transglutaminase-like domain-containing protein n=1 Tax=Tissierella simiarum TaxID=2841534 RepID=A0ABS6E6Z7_9FIRM|nr:transglutaminase-like domain-containing protein [Tissierella simiarum]MBU5438688.1 transglutaminase-like domain-containing protein [Tissierella simiarum]